MNHESHVYVRLFNLVAEIRHSMYWPYYNASMSVVLAAGPKYTQHWLLPDE